MDGPVWRTSWCIRYKSVSDVMNKQFAICLKKPPNRRLFVVFLESSDFSRRDSISMDLKKQTSEFYYPNMNYFTNWFNSF